MSAADWIQAVISSTGFAGIFIAISAFWRQSKATDQALRSSNLSLVDNGFERLFVDAQGLSEILGDTLRQIIGSGLGPTLLDLSVGTAFDIAPIH